MVEGMEGLCYGQQDGVEDYGVEGYEKGAEVEGGYDEDEMGFGWGFRCGRRGEVWVWGSGQLDG